MGELIVILLLALGATAFLHYRISKWRSGLKNPALICNLLSPLIYLPVVMNLYWKLNNAGKTYVTEAVLKYAFLIASAVALTMIHRSLWRRRGALPIRAARYIWPSLLIPFWNFLCLSAMMNGLGIDALIRYFYPISPSTAGFYFNYLKFWGFVYWCPVVINLVLLFMYLAYLAYIEDKLDHDFAKIREYWRRFAGKFSERGSNHSG